MSFDKVFEDMISNLVKLARDNWILLIALWGTYVLSGYVSGVLDKKALEMRAIEEQEARKQRVERKIERLSEWAEARERYAMQRAERRRELQDVEYRERAMLRRSRGVAFGSDAGDSSFRTEYDDGTQEDKDFDVVTERWDSVSVPPRLDAYESAYERRDDGFDTAVLVGLNEHYRDDNWREFLNNSRPARRISQRRRVIRDYVDSMDDY